jgi:hypothetical protein
LWEPEIGGTTHSFVEGGGVLMAFLFGSAEFSGMEADAA